MKMNFQLRPLLGLLLFFITLVIWASDDPQWDHYGTLAPVEGYHERDGKMWLATEEGLIAVDMETMEKTVYNTENSNIPSNAVESIDEDAEGRIWIGTYDNIIAMFDPGSGEWTTHPVPANLLPGGYPRMNSIAVANNGVVWIGSSMGLISFHEGNWESHTEEGGPINPIVEIAVSANGGFVYTASDALHEYHNGTWTNLSANTNLFCFEKSTVHISDDERVWFGTDIGALGSWDGDSWIEYSGQACSAGDMPNIAEDSNGKMYLMASQIGIFSLDGETWNISNFPIEGLTNWEMNSMAFDSSDYLWIGGLNKMLRCDLNGEEQAVVISDNSIPHLRVNNVFLGNDDQVHLLVGTGITSDIWTLNEAGLDILTSLDEISSIWKGVYDKHGDLWVIKALGLYKYDGENWQFPFEDQQLLEHGYYAMDYNAERDEIWFGAQGILLQYDITNDVFTDHSQYLNSLPLVGNADINYAIHIDVNSNGRTWVSIGKNRLLLRENEEWTLIDALEEGIGDSYFGHVFEDSEGILWCAFAGTVTRFDGENFEVNFLPGILIDAHETEEGKLYLQTEYDLYEEQEDGSFEALDFPEIQNDFQGIFRMRNLAVAENGNLYLSSTNGLYVYNPNGVNGIDPVLSGIENLPILDTQIQVYPNPSTTGIVNIAIPDGNNAEVELRVFNLQGQQIMQTKKQLQSNELELNLGANRKGMFVVQLINANTAFTTQVLLK